MESKESMSPTRIGAFRLVSSVLFVLAVLPLFSAVEYNPDSLYADFQHQLFLERVLASPMEERFYLGTLKIPGWLYSGYYRFYTGNTEFYLPGNQGGESFNTTYTNRGIELSGVGVPEFRFSLYAQRWDLPDAEGNSYSVMENYGSALLQQLAVDPWFFQRNENTAFSWAGEFLLFRSLRLSGTYNEPRFAQEEITYDFSLDVVDASLLPGLRNVRWNSRLHGLALKNLISFREGEPEWFSQTFFKAGWKNLDGLTWDRNLVTGEDYLSLQTSFALGPVFTTQRVFAARPEGQDWGIWRYSVSADPYMALFWLWTLPMGKEAHSTISKVLEVNANLVDGNMGGAVYTNNGIRFNQDFFDPRTGETHKSATLDSYYEVAASAPAFFEGSKMRVSVIYRTVPVAVEDFTFMNMISPWSRIEFSIHFGYMFAGIIHANRQLAREARTQS